MSFLFFFVFAVHVRRSHFPSMQARNALDSRRYRSAMRWAAVTVCLDLLAVLFSVLLGLMAVFYVLYSAAYLSTSTEDG